MFINSISESLHRGLASLIPKSIRRGFLKIIKIVQYLPVLWEDEDWDWNYILVLLRYKLERTSRCIQSNQIIVKEERDLIAKQIGVVTKLLQRAESDDYGDWLEKGIKSKYCEDFLAYLPKDSPLYSLMHGDGPDDYASRFTGADIEDIQRLWRESYLGAERMRSRDIDRAFKIMAKHIQYWWD